MWVIPCPHRIPQPRSAEYVSFEELFEAAAEQDDPADELRRPYHRRNTKRHRRPRPRTWICLAEWVLGGWAQTLRAAALMALAVVVVGGVAAALLGIYGVAAVATLLALLHVLPEPDRKVVLE